MNDELKLILEDIKKDLTEIKETLNGDRGLVTQVQLHRQALKWIYTVSGVVLTTALGWIKLGR